MKKIILFALILLGTISCGSDGDDAVLSPTQEAREQILGKWQIIAAGVVNNNDIIESHAIPVGDGASITFYSDNTYVSESEDPNSTEKSYGSWSLENNVLGMSWVDPGNSGNTSGIQYHDIYELSNSYLALISEGGEEVGDYEYWRFKRVN